MGFTTLYLATSLDLFHIKYQIFLINSIKILRSYLF